MRIEDKRSTTSWVPAVEILDAAIPHFRKQNFASIRKVVLLDQDYHKGPQAIGRYCAINGSKLADVELYFKWYENLPHEARQSKLYLTFMIVSTLMHEIYHHVIRGQHRLRQPDFKTEQQRADRWGDGAAGHVVNKLYPRDQYEPEWKRIQRILREAQASPAAAPTTANEPARGEFPTGTVL